MRNQAHAASPSDGSKTGAVGRTRLPSAARDARSGFTLVEMLVVIVIISILASLITVAAVGAIATAKQAAIVSEINQLSQAFREYKNQYGDYPPSLLYYDLGGGSQLPIQTKNFERHLLRAHPNHREPPQVISRLEAAGMTPAELLYFYLSGFSPNKDYPITGGGERTPLFEFDKSRLTFSRTIEFNLSGVNNLDLYTYHPKGLAQPYLYFDTSTKVAGAIPVPFQPDASGVAVIPYFEKDLDGLHLVNSTSFQILSAGLDDLYGRPILNPENIPLVPDGPFIEGHADNVSNFSEKNMEDSQP